MVLPEIAIVQVAPNDRLEAAVRNLKQQIHWYYYPIGTELNLKQEVQDLLDFYDDVLIMEERNSLWSQKKLVDVSIVMGELVYPNI